MHYHIEMITCGQPLVNQSLALVDDMLIEFHLSEINVLVIFHGCHTRLTLKFPDFSLTKLPDRINEIVIDLYKKNISSGKNNNKNG